MSVGVMKDYKLKLTPSTVPIFEVRLNQKILKIYLEGTPKRELVQKNVRFFGFESFLREKKLKRDFVWRVRCVSCVRTKVHMSGYLFGHTYMHVTYSNKILGNETVTTFSMHARECRMDTSKKQDGARQCMEHVHVRGKRCFFACEHKKHS